MVCCSRHGSLEVLVEISLCDNCHAATQTATNFVCMVAHVHNIDVFVMVDGGLLMSMLVNMDTAGAHASANGDWCATQREMRLITARQDPDM